MGTTQIAAALFQLQQLDLEIDRLIAEQQTLANSLQSTTSLKKLRAEQSAAQQQLSNDLQAQKEAEWALEEVVQRLKQLEQRMYGGSVNSPKELHALQQEVQHLRAQQARQEERVLETMEAAETSRDAAERKAQVARAAEKDWETANQAGMVRRQELEQKQLELQQKREGQAAALDAEFVRRYDSLRKAKQGRVVSKVEQNSCQWCRVILTPSELQRVRISSELQLCSNCGRILYYNR